MTLDLFKALEDDELEIRRLSDTLSLSLLTACWDIYRRQWELECEAYGVTVTVINVGAMVMCEYMDCMVNYSLLNSATL